VSDPEFDRVILDARLAFKTGQPVFIAGVSTKPGMRASAGQRRHGLDKLITAIEAEGWQAGDTEVVGSSAQVEFHYAPANRKESKEKSNLGCAGWLGIGVIVVIILAALQQCGH
jgi:hypothetical protein